MIEKATVKQLVEEFISNTEYYLVDLNITGDNKIAVEIDHFDGVSIDFCADLTRAIESKLDREVEDYELEVSSAGLTSPFKVLQQYEKNLGNEVEVIRRDGQKMIGELIGFDEAGITVAIEKQVKQEGAKRKTTVSEEHKIEFENIKSTKYHFRFK